MLGWRVVLSPDHETVFAGHAGQRVVELRIDHQDSSAGVFDDVLHFFGDEAEVDRHEHAAAAADTEQRGQQACRVVAHDGDAVADANPHRVECRGLSPGTFRHLGVRDRSPRLGRLCRLVDDCLAVRIDQLGAAEEVVDRECDLHG